MTTPVSPSDVDEAFCELRNAVESAPTPLTEGKINDLVAKTRNFKNLLDNAFSKNVGVGPQT